MIAACFLPHPPLLLGEYASLADPGAALRVRCRDMVAQLATGEPETLVVVSGAPRRPPAIDSRRPLGLRVARELLAGLGLPDPVEITVALDAGPDEVAACAERLKSISAGRSAVVVMGDGSARRGEKAPGHLDERAFSVDQRIADALSAGDPGPLTELDPAVAEELIIAGRAAWQVLAAIVDRPPERSVAHAEDPFGVLYHLALWTWSAHV
ncbi:hypothetical protein [Granulicoccus sp. GXG6511]|uniref:hypothetical protein n=1 Tax=Granulicoccus sp. GXG6511 TaxID=3381351 RepID=UPI003D7E9EEB